MLKPLIYAAVTALFVMQTANVPPAVDKRTVSSHVVALNQH